MTSLDDISNDFAIAFDFSDCTVDVKYGEVFFYNKEADVTVSLAAGNFEDVVRAFIVLRGDAFLVEE